MHFFPILIIGAVFVLGSKRRRRAPKASTAQPAAAPEALPPAQEPSALPVEVIYGDGPDRPDVIHQSVGAQFVISFLKPPGTNLVWLLKATPPDSSITQGNSAQTTSESVYAFKAAKTGRGSLVFHLQDLSLDGIRAPSEVVEFLTEVH